VLTLYQAEWCPYSSAVREILNELGLEFTVKPVEAWPDDRAELRQVSGGNSIPTLRLDNGDVVIGTRDIFRHLETITPWKWSDDHRQRYRDHIDARRSDATGQLIERFRFDRPGEPVEAEPRDLEVVNDEENERYLAVLGDRAIGLAAYHRRGNRISFTHTEIDSVCEGRGFGTALIAAALGDAKKQGLEIVPLCPFVAAYVKQHPEAVA
jgi:predicted GNAT family acetyltransferase/glutaredoxin